MNRGRLIVVSGPSGVGKGTLIRETIALLEASGVRSHVSVSATTRLPRAGETDGEHYYFMQRPVFELLIERGMLLEYAEYAGNLYGTPAAAVDEQMERGKVVFLDIEVEGAFQIRKCRSDAVLVFIMPPSEAELEKRLRERGTESGEKIARRLEIGKAETARAGEYDKIIVNDRLEVAASELADYIKTLL